MVGGGVGWKHCVWPGPKGLWQRSQCQIVLLPLCRLHAHFPPKQSWLDEWLWTFLLVLVVFSVASSKRDSNAFFGLAIGCVVLAGDSFFDTYSKGFFNPGVGTGVCLLSVFEKKGAYALWIYWVSEPAVSWCSAVSA